MPFWAIFELEFYETTVVFKISTLKFVILEFLSHTVNISIGSAFSKGPGSDFSEGPDPGLGSFYRVWPVSLRTSFSLLKVFEHFKLKMNSDMQSAKKNRTFQEDSHNGRVGSLFLIKYIFRKFYQIISNFI